MNDDGSLEWTGIRMRIRSIDLRIPLHLAALLIMFSAASSPMAAFQRHHSNVPAPVDVTMDSLVDRYRPLLIFAPESESQALVEQLRLMVLGSKELRERQVLVMPIVEESKQRLSPGDLDMGYLRPDEAVQSRTRFHVGKGEFVVVLIGKDGGEKFRTHAPVTIETLNAIIDAMPMRRQEVRDGHAK